ncbi:adenylate kinase [[Phormidium ambiguum] IAM M-71]|uniref:Adenylate kinase n=1 Tax=[Phormidium ambiguum] IAM M-71 TaxID=454136 RepID=A0A1U7IU03_9CYAN|nr:adenylate kinase [Phormidium ambiguum]OKH41000.1 adenylate kinase [Phormidium ambiguum IAM M-71]
MNHQRISVIGTSGSGKTTLAKQISQRLAIPHIELDALYWEPNWVEVAENVFQARVLKALSSDRWVVDGNYSPVRDIVWVKADTIVWLNYSLLVILTRLLWRTLERSLTQKELWNGNRETLQKSFFSRDSILLWAIQTYSKRRKEYPILFTQPEYSHLKIVELRSPKNATDWLNNLYSS